MHGSPAQVFSNPLALQKTNLEPPAVLELFESLCKKGILKSSLPLPKNLKTLEGYIEDINLHQHYGGKNMAFEKRKKAILAVSFGTSHTDTCKAVSYTHLDVYKRQLSWSFAVLQRKSAHL